MHDECWGYANDACPETWCGNCKTRAEAIAEGRVECDGQFFVMKGRKCYATEFAPDAKDVAEMMWDRANDEVGDIVADFPDLSAEQRAEFDAFTRKWASQIECRFWVADGDAEAIGPDEPPGAGG